LDMYACCLLFFLLCLHLLLLKVGGHIIKKFVTKAQ
jgi:hypothetical protein